MLLLAPVALALNAGPIGTRAPRVAPALAALRMQVETNEEMKVTNDAEASMDFAETAAPETQERFKAISLNALDEWAEKFPRLKPELRDIKMSSLIFPFKASPYLVEELIDWEMEGDIKDDPFYRLVFPTMTMLAEHHRVKLEAASEEGDPFKLKDVVDEIREDLNPHPAGQKELNAPKKDELTGVQHKYSETVLFFASAAQTCHAYCTYCFRWAQFIGDSDLRFAQKDAGSLFDYLAEHEEVSDILFTGGDPMFMKTRLLKQYLEPFKDPTFLPHVKNLRIGTRALTFWPQRFTTDDDADELMVLLREVKDQGNRHMAIMSHLGHVRELQTDKVRAAIKRLREEAFVNIRSQSPVMRGIEPWLQPVGGAPAPLAEAPRRRGSQGVAPARHALDSRPGLLEAAGGSGRPRRQPPYFPLVGAAGINDDAEVWAEKWREEVRLGIVPYYMFMARDTGAQAFFDVPLVRAQRLYADAIRSTSGLCRTARGPSMSCTPGKVEVVGVQEVLGVPAFILRFLQCRDEDWVGKVFFAKYDPKAVWFDDLEPLDGMELPWQDAGLPRPCIDEPCQIEFMNAMENA